MENNDSPYVYEKPLRAKGARFTKAVTAVGLVAFGTVIGGGAFANSVEAEAESQYPQPIITIPFVKQEPQKNSSAIELPGLANQSYGNTSNATPSAGGSQSGSNLTSYQEHEDDVEDSDDHDRGERDLDEKDDADED
ncbi:MAG: hypothetical protein RI927_611 [Actinomycetota bacterium]|jgi:hypothetical protein